MTYKYVVCGKLLELHFSALLFSNCGETVRECSWYHDLSLQHMKEVFFSVAQVAGLPVLCAEHCLECGAIPEREG